MPQQFALGIDGRESRSNNYRTYKAVIFQVNSLRKHSSHYTKSQQRLVIILICFKSPEKFLLIFLIHILMLHHDIYIVGYLIEQLCHILHILVRRKENKVIAFFCMYHRKNIFTDSDIFRLVAPCIPACNITSYRKQPLLSIKR